MRSDEGLPSSGKFWRNSVIDGASAHAGSSSAPSMRGGRRVAGGMRTIRATGATRPLAWRSDWVAAGPRALVS